MSPEKADATAYYPPMLRTLLLVNLTATVFMTGLIWFVQIVHYPLFDGVAPAEFAGYEARHTRATSWVVGPAMAVELITAVGLVLCSRSTQSGEAGGSTLVPALPAWVGLTMVGLLALVTLTLSWPQHVRLTRGYDPDAHRLLVSTNWLRTALWTGRSLVVGWMVYRLLPTPAAAAGAAS